MSLISLAVSAVWVAGFWVLSRDRSDTWAITLIGMIASLITVGLAAANVWPQARTLYPGDSYWTLGWIGRIGVIAISGIGCTCIYLMLAAKSRLILRVKTQGTNTAWVVIDLAIGLGLFAVIYSVSPQIFYGFYRLIIPGLPQQVVIEGWIDPDRLRFIARMREGGSLSDHLAGICGWGIVPFTLWLHTRAWWRGEPA